MDRISCAALAFAALCTLPACGDDSAPPTDAPGAPAPDVQLTDDAGQPLAELATAPTAVGAASAAAIHVTNHGAGATGPLAISIAGAAANDFALDNTATTCAAAALAPGAACVIALRFQPLAAGAREATLTLASAPGGTQTVALHGAAFAPSLHFEPPSLDFGTHASTGFAPQTIALVNSGTDPAPLDSIAIAGAFSQLATTCGATLAAGATCDIVVGFSVTTLGAHAGTLTVTSAGTPLDAALAATTAMPLTAAKTGTGAGTVTSAPGGIACGATCSALFTAAVTLTAAPDAGSTFVGWTYPGCGAAATCTVPAVVAAQTATATFALTSSAVLSLSFAGGGAGEVQILSFAGEVVATCTASCSVPVNANELLDLRASTPDVYGGLSGACTAASPSAECFYTPPAGTSSVTATFTADPRARWTRLLFPGESFVAAAFDSSGNLIAGTGAHLVKLDAAGNTVWTLPLGIVAVATGPGDAIYAHTGAAIAKLDATGAAVWTAPLDATTTGCTAAERFARCIATAADGSVAVNGPHGFGRYDAAGALVWEVAQPSTQFSVVVDSTGTVSVIDEDGSTAGPGVRRFTPAGVELAAIPTVTREARATLAVDPADHLLGAASGHHRTILQRTAPGGAVDWTAQIATPSSTPGEAPGVCAAGTGAIALYDVAFDGGEAVTFDLTTYDASGAAIGTAIHRDALSADTDVGLVPADLAADAAGDLALVGNYFGVAYHGGIVQTFTP